MNVMNYPSNLPFLEGGFQQFGPDQGGGSSQPAQGGGSVQQFQRRSTKSPYNDDDINVTLNTGAGVVFGTVGAAFGIFALIFFVGFVLAIVSTVKGVKVPRKNGNLPAAVIALIVVSWVSNTIIPIPVVNIVIPSLLIHATRYPTGALRNLLE